MPLAPACFPSLDMARRAGKHRFKTSTPGIASQEKVENLLTLPARFHAASNAHMASADAAAGLAAGA